MRKAVEAWEKHLREIARRMKEKYELKVRGTIGDESDDDEDLDPQQGFEVGGQRHGVPCG